MSGMRWALPLLVVVLLVVGGTKLGEPSTVALLQAVRELGPVSGWRCASGATYSYDPRRDGGDSTLLSDAPEQAVTNIVVERVEANLRGGDTILWSHLDADDGSVERRVYVLSPGQLRAVTLERDSAPTTICYSHLGNWRIIAEHRL
jgi:hypothetical protein